jgi:pimeloyl-ACP methyl ester carboxylesterase
MNSINTAFRKFGPPPYRLVLVHGGPGAAGYLAPLAGRLSRSTGVIDAYQTGDNIDSLLQELFTVITGHTELPVTLLGHSWGAWLSLLFASSHPRLIRKLVLVASAPLEEKYVPWINETRMSRMDTGEITRLSKLVSRLEMPGDSVRNFIFREIAGLLKKADAFDASGNHDETVHLDYGRYQSVWQEAEEIRRSGELLRRAGKIRCPVLAIHGDYDPHPADGVRLPLQGRMKDFKFILLEKCGHEPWNEKHACGQFYELLQKELEI